MHDLCQEPVPGGSNGEDDGFFTRLIEVLDQNYPQGWRSWEVENYSYTDLFGKHITSAVEQKLRFAIPTAELARAYSPDNPTLSEKKYRSLKRKLLSWPLGRALIYAPHSLMEKVHAKSYEFFMTTVKLLKPKLTSRKRSLTPNSAISSGEKRTREHSPANRRELRSPSGSRRDERAHSASSKRNKLPNKTRESISSEQQLSFFEKMMSVLTTNSQIVANVASKVSELTEKMDMNQQGTTSLVDSCEERSERFEGSGTESDSESGLPGPSEASQNTEPSDVCSFAPCTTEAEPKLMKANPVLAEQGRKCQRLNDSNWRNVRYADVQKHFHATPVFSALRVNSILATNTPTWSSLAPLERADLTLGAITHGLLLQRAAFEEACKKMDKKSRQEIQKHFLDSSSEFKKMSDNLLQYTCGRRAEVIQSRREIYKCPNKVLNDILHEIPPSDTHLFAEDKLTEAVKEQGGVYKLFPKGKPYVKHAKKSASSKGSSNKTKNPQGGRHNSKKPPTRPFRHGWKQERRSSGSKPPQPAEKKP